MPTVAEIAARIGGVLCGDGAAEVTGLAGVRDSGASEITFLSNPHYAVDVPATAAAALVVDTAWQGECPVPLIRVADVERAFAQAVALFAPPPVEPVAGVHPTAVVAEDAVLADNISIGPHCVIEAGATVAIAKTGSVSLEIALVGVPQLAVYHVSRFNELLGRFALKLTTDDFQRVSLVNHIMAEDVIPEFVQAGRTKVSSGGTSPLKIAEMAAQLLDKGSAIRADILRGYERLRARLGHPHAADRAA